MGKRRNLPGGNFKPPTDVTTWWIAPHCGPGHTNRREICGFCGETCLDCALEATELVNGKHYQPGIVLEGHEDGCGGSGFWCRGCSRFWAQDACGESNGSEHRAADGATLTVGDDGYVYCCCGRKLMKEAGDGD
jgi:hypothetical protein